MSDGKCCVQTCLKSRGSNNSLFRLPSDSIRQQIWRNTLKIDQSDVSKLYVCSCHYKKNYFKGNTKDASPHLKKKVPSENVSNKRRRSIRKCIVPTCRNTEGDKTVTLFKFPENKEKLRLFKYKLNIEQTKLVGNSRVCSDHFNSTDFFPCATPESKKCLKNNAVPTLTPVIAPKTLRNMQPDHEQPDSKECKLERFDFEYTVSPNAIVMESSQETKHSSQIANALLSESLTRLPNDQLLKFAQNLIHELPEQILPIAQRLLDELQR